MTFCLKFLSLTVKIGQNKNKIGNISYKELTHKIRILLEKISEEKIVLEDCYIKAE